MSSGNLRLLTEPPRGHGRRRLRHGYADANDAARSHFNCDADTHADTYTYAGAHADDYSNEFQALRSCFNVDLALSTSRRLSRLFRVFAAALEVSGVSVGPKRLAACFPDRPAVRGVATKIPDVRRAWKRIRTN